MPPSREDGEFAIDHPPIVVVAASSAADRRIRPGCKRLEEVVVVRWTNNGGMGEHPPIASIVVPKPTDDGRRVVSGRYIVQDITL